MENILFDLDGTLSDNSEGIIGSTLYALEKMGMRESNPEQLYSFIGPPLSHSFQNRYNLSDSDTSRAIDFYRENYRARGIHQNKLYDGIEHLLATLYDAGKNLYVATGKPEPFAKDILERFNLSKYFKVIRGTPLLVGEHKTSKVETVASLIADFGLQLETTIMVGDRSDDVVAGTCNGIATVGVLYGFGSLEELSGTTHIVQTVEELRSMLLEL